MSATSSFLPGHRCLAEPALSFHPTRSEDRHLHPLKGLFAHGPYSRSLVNHLLDPIRLAVIAPSNEIGVVQGLIDELETHQPPHERVDYLIPWPGFSRVFGLRVVAGQPDVLTELPADLDIRLKTSARPHVLLAETLNRAISTLQTQRTAFDVLLIYLPERWSNGFTGPPGDDFDLHDFLKATTAMHGIPTQIAREDRALRYRCRASVMWRLGIALYCKAGGIPWKLADVDPETAYIGLCYAVRSTAGTRPQFITCCSQVFDADGAGLEFIAYDVDQFHYERENPYLSRNEMLRLMSRSLALYQRRHGGRAPKRVVIHKSTEFTREEVDGCFDAWRAADGLELLHVQQEVAWRGVQLDPPRRGASGSEPSAYPVRRGTCLQLGTRDMLIWTQGNAPDAANNKNFYKEGKGIPHPLLLTRYAGHGGWMETCRAVLGLSKMNWNNDGLYDRLPVTMAYASELAKILKRMPNVTAKEYQFRFFM